MRKIYEININYKIMKKYVFCKHWYDPTNSAINHKVPSLGIWEYDYNVRKKCLLKKGDQKGGEFCKKFKIKL